MTTPTPSTDDRLRTWTGRRVIYVRRGACDGHWLRWPDARDEGNEWVSDKQWRDLRAVPERRVVQ